MAVAKSKSSTSKTTKSKSTKSTLKKSKSSLESKNTKQLINEKISRLNNRYLVIKNFIALFFVFLGFAVLYPLNTEGDATRAILIIIATFVLISCLALIGEFAIKTLRLQVDPEVKRFSGIVSLNGLFGLVAPLFLLNIVLRKIMIMLSEMTHNGSALCRFRFDLIDFYKFNDTYFMLNQLIFYIVLILIAFFLFGGMMERRRELS